MLEWKSLLNSFGLNRYDRCYQSDLNVFSMSNVIHSGTQRSKYPLWNLVQPKTTQERSWSQGCCFISAQIAQNTDLIVVRFPWACYKFGLSALWRSNFISALNSLYALYRCPLWSLRFIKVILWGLDQKMARVKFFVRFSKVSALEHVRIRQVLLYAVNF